MEPLAVAFGTAVVAAMATETWQQARDAVAAVWRRARAPQPADALNTELNRLRRQVLAARRDNRADQERALAGVWQGRLQELLLDDPGMAEQLQHVLDRVLNPMLVGAGPDRARPVLMTGSSHDTSTFNQVTGDQTNIIQS